MSTASRLLPPDRASRHSVRFYSDEAILISQVADFADEALRCGGSAIIIATEAHLAMLRPLLRGFSGPHDDTPWFSGRLTMLDADTTLAGLMAGDWPDEELFLATVGKLIDAETSRARPVHAYGEMVTLLCERGRFDAALHLEELWNRLGERHPFKLLCGYPDRVFASDEQAHHFRCVCDAHGRVFPSELLTLAQSDHDGAEAGKWALQAWQHRAIAAEHEVNRRREAEATLRRREQELVDFLDNAAEGVHRVGADGTILWANAAELKLLGYGFDEYVGRHIAEFHVDGDVITDMLARLAAGETLYDQPARLRCKDGTIRHVLINSNGCFQDGRLAYTRCFTRDATDRVARVLAEQQRDAVLMQAPVAAALLAGPRHIFRMANRRYCELVGRTGLVGLPHAEVLPELQDTALPMLLDAAYESGQPRSVDECEVALASADGNTDRRWLRLHLEPFRSVHGVVEGIILVAIDVSESVRIRRRLESSHAERERLLQSLTEASQAKDEFLAMLGHELRNPLSPIVTALQLIRMRGIAGAEREHRIIERQVDHLVRLVDDLLDVSRITRGNIELKRESTRIADVLAKAVEMVSPLLEQRQHRLTVDVDGELIWQGDPVRLAQAVANLLSNAARYTDIGGDVQLRARRDGDHAALITVRDNGIGIAPDILSRIFDLFFQGPRKIDRAQGGLGIGLALVKNLVELHGGTVTAASAGPGKGSEFTIRLPITAGTGAVTPAPTERGRPRADTAARRILLVDDNVDAVQALAELLRSCGHRVEAVYDPVSALQIAPAFEPDVAMLDIGLPVMDGYELARRLRDALHGRPCLMIAVTGYGQVSDRDRSREAGFDAHLVKPVGLDVLLEQIERFKG